MSRPRVVVASPQIALNAVIEHLGLAEPGLEAGIHETAVVGAGAELAEDVRVGPYAVIGSGARIGSRTQIHAHAVIEPGATLGAGCRVHPHAVVGTSVRLGDDVVIGASAVVGGTGFGFGFGARGPERLHHLGSVEIGDRSELGIGVTVDRARFGSTRIGCDVKIDNQVHVAHNCSIGDRTVIAAQVGLAGSTHIGSQCLIGGQAGFAGHLRIADGVQIAAKAGVTNNIETPGQYFGYVAKERRAAFREVASMAKLPAALREIRALKEEVEVLRGHLESKEPPRTRGPTEG